MLKKGVYGVKPKKLHSFAKKNLKKWGKGDERGHWLYKKCGTEGVTAAPGPERLARHA